MLHAGYPGNQTRGEDSSPAGANRKGSTGVRAPRVGSSGKEYVLHEKEPTEQVLWV